MAFSESSAGIVTLFVTSVLYGESALVLARFSCAATHRSLLGITTITFIACLHILLSSNGHYALTATAFAMFAVATLDIGVMFDRCIKVFADSAPLHSELSNWWNIVAYSNSVTQTFIGDAILVRLFRNLGAPHIDPSL